MLRNFVAAFDEAGDEQLFAIGVAEDDAGAIRWGNHAEIIVKLLVGEQGIFPDFRFRLFGNFSAGPTDGEIRIVHRAAAGGTGVRLGTQAAAASRAGNTAQRKDRAIVAVSREFFVVAVGNGTCAVNEARADDGADNLQALGVADADAIGEANR